MIFRETQPIYLQIADYVCEKILLKEWQPEQRIPSVRELAVTLEVNPNTILRAYEFLQNQDIIVNTRGVGLFVASRAMKNAQSYLYEQLVERNLPGMFRMLALLDMGLDEIKPAFEKYLSKNYKQLQRQRHENK
jgi:DNA-binding transcriptional regulator YhcF (GntR family)